MDSLVLIYDVKFDYTYSLTLSLTLTLTVLDLQNKNINRFLKHKFENNNYY